MRLDPSKNLIAALRRQMKDPMLAVFKVVN
jgi:hypothetical protein